MAVFIFPHAPDTAAPAVLRSEATDTRHLPAIPRKLAGTWSKGPNGRRSSPGG